MTRRSLLLIAVMGLALAGCSTSDNFAGLNYANVTLPSGENWTVAGGKDETNVTFEVVRADGTTVRYHADNADASTVIKTMAEKQAAILDRMTNLIHILLPAPPPVP